MAKYRFSAEERYALWRTWNCRCGHCCEPLRFADVTVDHIIPETLLSRPNELNPVLKSLGLSGDFAINDYCNWLPCHGFCNSTKGPSLYEKGSAVFMLERAKKKIAAARGIEKTLLKERNADKVLAKLVAAIEQGNIAPQDVYAAAGPVDGMSFVFYVPTIVTFQAVLSDDVYRELGARTYPELVKSLHADLIAQLDAAVTAWFWEGDGFSLDNPPEPRGGILVWQMVCAGLRTGELEQFASGWWTIQKAEPAFEVPDAYSKWVISGSNTAFDIRQKE